MAKAKKNVGVTNQISSITNKPPQKQKNKQLAKVVIPEIMLPKTVVEKKEKEEKIVEKSVARIGRTKTIKKMKTKFRKKRG